MKRILFVTAFCTVMIQFSYSQYYCEVISEGEKTSDSIPGYMDYIPDSNTPIKFIRLNFHFMLLEDTNPDAPGNFTSEDDGMGDNDFTGYDWIDDR